MTTPRLVKTILNLIFKLFPKDRMMKPIIYKNLESHAIKNMKAALMYSVAICFLVYSDSCFHSTMKFMR